MAIGETGPVMEFADCGGGCGGDSGGGDSSGGGCDTPDAGSDPSPFNPLNNNTVYTSCTSSNDRIRRRPTTPARPDDRKQKRPLWRSILGLAPTEGQSRWLVSVMPSFFTGQMFRPGKKEIEKLYTRKLH